MARVTVEDCVDKVPNRFDLVLLAAHRAREISTGSAITVIRDNDKNPVVSLREIADETQSADELRERLIESNQIQIEVDEPEEDEMALLMGIEDDVVADDDMSEEKIDGLEGLDDFGDDFGEQLDSFMENDAEDEGDSELDSFFEDLSTIDDLESDDNSESEENGEAA